MSHRFLFSGAALALLAGLSFVSAQATGQQTTGASTKAAPAKVARTAWGTPDLQGIWSTSTVTPMERPKEFADRERLTEAEAAAFEKRVVNQRNTDNRREGNSDVTAAYNDAWYDYGSKYIPTRRTSLVIDPPDGKIPALTPAGKERAAHAIPLSGLQQFSIVNTWLERGLWERCITRGVPEVMLPTAYNNNYRIVQTRDYVAILSELIHDARVIPISGRPHPPATIRQWMGDSVGHWEGDTLVVDTTNFTNKTTFRGASENLHVIERFSRPAADILNYQATIDDPTTFTKPWTFELPARKLNGLMYEYACHEGNHGMENLLSASRAAEREAAKKGSEKQ